MTTQNCKLNMINKILIFFKRIFTAIYRGYIPVMQEENKIIMQAFSSDPETIISKLRELPSIKLAKDPATLIRQCIMYLIPQLLKDKLLSEYPDCLDVKKISELMVKVQPTPQNDQNLSSEINSNKTLTVYDLSDELMRSRIREMVNEVLPDMIKKIVTNDTSTENDLQKPVDIIEEMGLKLDMLSYKCQESLARAITICDLRNGKLRSHVKIDSIPVRLQKDEIVIWAWNNVEGTEIRTTTRWRGNHQGLSIRLAKGLYYRIGEMQGDSNSYHKFVSIGQGSLIITNKSLDFICPLNILRIQYEKIVASEIFEEGILIYRSAKNDKPIIFKINDRYEWFMRNVLKIVINQDLDAKDLKVCV